MAKETITIILADSFSLFRLGIRATLKGIKHLTIVAETSSGPELVELTSTLKPDVVITGFFLKEMDGVQATTIITKEYPKTNVIALTIYNDESHILDMLKAGAIGYLLINTEKQELITAIEQVAKKTAYFCQEINERITQLLTKNPGYINQHFIIANFSLREQGIIQMICEGKTNKEMAYQLHISKRTVESHRRRIMDKIGVSSTAEIITYAISKGLFTGSAGH